MTTKEIQVALNTLGYGPLTVDGKEGPATLCAIKKFQKDSGLTGDGKVGLRTLEAFVKACPPSDISTPKKGKIFNTNEIIAKYGQPGPSNLITIVLPYPMIIDWDRNSFTKKIQCHKLIAEPLKKVLEEILSNYGLEEIERLGLNIYGGCYHFRKMRGGSEWSRHSWGIALDLDPSKNQLKWGRDKASFAKPEYKKMIEIFYKHGFIGLGPEENRDWMHFQIGI